MSLTVRPFPPGLDRMGWRLVRAVTRRLGMSIACGALALTLLAEARAGDSIEDALALISEHRYPEARRVLDSLAERAPDAPAVRLLLGILSARERDVAGALAIFESLRRDRPDMFEVHNNLAVLYAGQGRLEDARGALLAAIELQPDAVVYANLGDVYTRLAERAYARADAVRTQGVAAPEGGAGVGAVSATPAEPAAAAGDRPAEPAAEAREVVGADEAAPAICVRAGRFADRAAAAGAAAWMRSRGADAVEVRREEREVVRNYRVYLPAPATREAAAAAVRELRERGVSDVGIIVRGPLANAVSLGVFRSESNASRRVAQVEKFGYPVALQANTAQVGEYVVEARTTGERSALDADWTAAFPEQRIDGIACAGRG